ncbi:MAG: DUF1549 domain-containing protein [Verrucomicrobia bacterium]|nr:DUF1549 domain-containing protein [Verrucomicrobiota bacterium]
MIFARSSPRRTLVNLRVSAKLFCVGAVAGAATTGQAADAGVRFSRDIQPILAENCFACHGPDTKARKANLRLDTKDGIFANTPKHGRVVVPGKPDQSELWKRIVTTDPDEVMPPPESHKELKPEQKEKFKQWIGDGAPWQSHWAYAKPERPPLPDATKLNLHDTHFKIRNPLDAFVLARLQSKGLTPNPEADRRTLARRLSLDLTGLLPKPETVAAFVKDRSPNYCEKFVKKLLASPAWGEHRARYWLDAARYADTHGLHFDNYREMWPYRDWVINAFNRNLPFNQFTIEQFAGDLLPEPTDDQIVATGFQRCNMTTNEGGTIEEENLANYANDRVTTLGWVFLGTTINCCACHDHKFDPFTQKDFYSLAAFFRNTTQTGFDKNIRESDLYRVVPQTAAESARWQALPAQIEAARQARNAQAEAAGAAFDNWLAAPMAATLGKDVHLPGQVVCVPLNEGEGTNLSARVDGKSKRLAGPFALTWSTNLGPFGLAPVFAEKQNVVIGDVGNFDTGEPFSFGAWVFVPLDFKGEGAVLARMGGEEQHHRGWDLLVRDEEFVVQMINRWPNIAMEAKSKDKALKHGQWQHLFVTYDGSGRTKGLKLFADGVEVGTNRDRNSLEGGIRSPFPLRIGSREQGAQLKNVAVQDARIFRGALSSAEVRALAAAPLLKKLFDEVLSGSTNTAPRDALKDYFFVTQDRNWQQAQAKLAALENELAAIRGRSPVTLVQQEKKESEPMAQILFRGQYDKPKDKVGAATPAVLHPLSPKAAQNRLGLAQWLVSPENPLTARVTVNRFWQEIFGVGLVKSAEDFGTTSEPPVNQDLLDWLAVEFQSSGWNIKRLFELIVTSSAYRQSAETTPEKLEKDPQNRLLSRGSRFRMDAEMVRDCALAASGLLVEKIGGPSVKPYQPDGIWEAVAMPESNTRYYQRDSGEGLYRRSLTRFGNAPLRRRRWTSSTRPAWKSALCAASAQTRRSRPWRL